MADIADIRRIAALWLAVQITMKDTASGDLKVGHKRIDTWFQESRGHTWQPRLNCSVLQGKRMR